MLAKQFDAKAQDGLETLERLSDSDWKKVTAAEQWSVGVTAHHLAGALHVVPEVVKAIVAGRPLEPFRLGSIDQLNAEHAKNYADCTKAETIELYTKGVAAAVNGIRALNDDQLTKSGTLATGMPPMTAEQVIMSGLILHIDEHFGSIRKTVGHN